MSISMPQKLMALQQGDGLVRARYLSWYLSIGTFGLCVPVAYGCLNGNVPPWLMALLSVTIGWLIAERNAMDDRAKRWPEMSNYIDWPRVEADLRAINQIEQANG